MAGVQGPLKGPGSSRVFSCSLMLSEPIFKHSDTKWDFFFFLGGGGGGGGNARQLCPLLTPPLQIERLF